MAEFEISSASFAGLRGCVIIITGASSGIGLATTTLLLNVGALVVAGDLNPVPLDHPNLSFQQTNITSWQDLLALFDLAESQHGKVDHVFANAGITGRSTFLEDREDENGKPAEPDLTVIDINLKGNIYTTVLGLRYIKKHKIGSIVLTASASSFQTFGLTDYAVAKHGVLGLMRGLVPNLGLLHPSIRVNSIAPNWTATGIVTQHLAEGIGARLQGPDIPARSVALLMADESRQGQLIYSVHGRYVEIEEALFLKSVQEEIIQKYQPEESDAFQRMSEILVKPRQ